VDNYSEVLIVLIGGVILFLVLSGIIIFVLFFYQKKRFQHKEQLITMQNTFEQELLKTQLETQETTFHQISEELHDNVGQLLSTTKMLIGITERALHEPPDSLKTASETLSKAIHDLRSLSKSLSPEWLHQFNVIDNLQAELDRLKAAKQIQVSFTTNSSMLPLEPQEQVMLFRVMQEALQNCIKHSGATALQVSVTVTGDSIYLCLADNGRGFNGSPAGKNGVGIMNMKHRAALLGGNIAWASGTGSGTKVEINIPAQKPGI
jgi:signal transduction histidine kinase